MFALVRQEPKLPNQPLMQENISRESYLDGVPCCESESLAFKAKNLQDFSGGESSLPHWFA
jgi:hypothetical protein